MNCFFVKYVEPYLENMDPPPKKKNKKNVPEESIKGELRSSEVLELKSIFSG